MGTGIFLGFLVLDQELERVTEEKKPGGEIVDSGALSVPGAGGEVLRCLEYRGGDPGESIEGKVNVVMCVWKRPRRASAVFGDLAKQDYPLIDLSVWNNEPGHRDYYDRILDAARSAGRFESVRVFHSPENLKAGARYPVAALGDGEFTVIVDDDEKIASNYVSTMVKHIRERGGACSGYARWLHSGKSYWECPGGGFENTWEKEVDYIGPGAAIFRREWLCDPLLHARPKEFDTSEDLWLCYCLHQQGIKRYKVNVVGVLDYADDVDLPAEILGIKLPEEMDPELIDLGRSRTVRREKDAAMQILVGKSPTLFTDKRTENA